MVELGTLRQLLHLKEMLGLHAQLMLQTMGLVVVVDQALRE